MIPYWFWYLTTAVTFVAIVISALVVMGLKFAELDKRYRVKSVKR